MTMLEHLHRGYRDAAVRKGRAMAEEAFLEFHGRWTMDLIAPAVERFRGRAKNLRLPHVSATLTAEIATIAVATFEARLREQVAGGQHVTGMRN